MRAAPCTVHLLALLCIMLCPQTAVMGDPTIQELLAPAVAPATSGIAAIPDLTQALAPIVHPASDVVTTTINYTLQALENSTAALSPLTAPAREALTNTLLSYTGATHPIMHSSLQPWE